MSIKVISKENYKIILDDGKVSTIHQTIVEVKENSVKTHKIITLFGLKLKIKRKGI